MKKSARKPKDLAPAGLSADSLALWRSCVSEFELSDAPGLALLESACRCWDRASAARTAIDVDGLTIKDRFGAIKPHPLLAAERDALAGFRQAIKQLGFDIEPARPPGRPPGR